LQQQIELNFSADSLIVITLNETRGRMMTITESFPQSPSYHWLTISESSINRNYETASRSKLLITLKLMNVRPTFVDHCKHNFCAISENKFEIYAIQAARFSQEKAAGGKQQVGNSFGIIMIIIIKSLAA